MIPYYGKNKVKYDQFDWRVYKSPHFEIYYYPEFEQHLARVSSYLESAYEKLSAGLKHEVSQPIPAILYKTWTEFEQTNLNPGFLPEGVLAFAEPGRGRLTLPIDLPPDRLNGLIQHEMTHIFAFDIIPRTILQRGIPLWIDEGLASYFEGVWAPLDLMMIRDAAITEQIPQALEVGLPAPVRTPRLQPRPRRLRVHREPLRQGGHPAVPLHPAQGDPGRHHRRHLPAGLPHLPRGLRPGLREVAAGALQALPRQGAAQRLRAHPLARTRRRRPTPRSSASPPAPRARSSPPSPPIATKARRTSCCSPPGTGACSGTSPPGSRARTSSRCRSTTTSWRGAASPSPPGATTWPSSAARASAAPCTS